MDKVPEGPTLVQGQSELLHTLQDFVYGATRECTEHGPRVKVLYQGPACPYCLTVDDLEFTRERGDRC